MNDYVFVDDNNGHFTEYFNFISDATEQQILKVTADMAKENPVYGRLGSKINDLINALCAKGYNAERKHNAKNRCAIDRVQIHCISGNY